MEKVLYFESLLKGKNIDGMKFSEALMVENPLDYDELIQYKDYIEAAYKFLEVYADNDHWNGPYPAETYLKDRELFIGMLMAMGE